MTILNRLEHDRGLLVRALSIAVLFTALSADLLWSYFGEDDLMNLYKALEQGWAAMRGLILFWSTAYIRPAGNFFYLTLYRIFGFHPFPYKLAVFVFLLVNLVIAYFVATDVLRSKYLGLLALLLVTYHAAEYELYYNFGTIYDLICFTFYYFAFALYLKWRASQPLPAWKLLLLALLQIAALCSKEMGVSLPVLILLYELGAEPIRVLRPWLRRVMPTVLLLGPICLAFILAKRSGAGSLLHHPAYRPVISLHRFLEGMSHYLEALTYFHFQVQLPATAIILVAITVTALLIRSRLMLVGWLWFIIAMLPVVFIPARAGFVMYIPLIGLGVALAAGCRDLFERVRRFLPVRFADVLDPSGLPVFLLLFVACFWLNAEEKPRFAGLWGSLNKSYRQWANDFARLNPHPKAGAEILLLGDPFPEWSWDALFVPSLVRGDLHLRVARVRFNALALSPDLVSQYDEVYRFDDPSLKKLSGVEVDREIEIVRKMCGDLRVIDGVYLFANDALWTKPSFAFRVKCPAGTSRCKFALSLDLKTNAPVMVTLDGRAQSAPAFEAPGNLSRIEILLSNAGEHVIRYTLPAPNETGHSRDMRENSALIRQARFIDGS